MTVSYRPEPRTYWVDGVEVPSVTQVLDILHKPALTWWGQKVAIAGVGQLLHEGMEGEETKTLYDELLMQDVDSVLKRLTAAKLTVNHVRDQAATRGSSVHQAFEDYYAHGIEPNPANYPPQEEGYVRGLIKFIEEVPLLRIETELMVGSKRHGYAGRLDLIAYLQEAWQVKTGPRTTRYLPEGQGIWDVKTSKSVYLSHKLQLSGYRESVEECGYGRSDYEVVILLRDNGTYDLILNDTKPYQFLSVLETYKALR